MSQDLIRLMHVSMLHAGNAALRRRTAAAGGRRLPHTGDGWLVKFDLAGVRPEEIELETCTAPLTA